MFYAGDIRSGIALAMQETKAVACLVDDDGAESTMWKNEYLADEEISSLLIAKAVVLHLKAGSQEAHFLHAFCPVDIVPTFVVIQNGDTAELLNAGTPVHEFKRRLIACFNGGSVLQSQEAPQVTAEAGDTRTNETDRTAPPVLAATLTEDTPSEVPAASNKSHRASGDESSSAAKRGGDRQHVPESPVSERIRREEQKPPIPQIPQSPPTTISPPPSQPSQTPKRETTPRKPEKSPLYRMRVRLFDGSTLHNAFQPHESIRTAVRPWLDATRTDGKKPYRLRLILTPEPNRIMLDEDEDLPFAALGVEKTSSYVMVAARGFKTPGFGASGPGNTSSTKHMSLWTWLTTSIPVHAGIAGTKMAYEVLARGVNVAAAMLGSILGIGRSAPGMMAGAGRSGERVVENGLAPETADAAATTTTRDLGRDSHELRHRGNNIRTLRDTEADGNRDNGPVYNGNSTNFFPRDRDDDS